MSPMNVAERKARSAKKKASQNKQWTNIPKSHSGGIMIKGCKRGAKDVIVSMRYLEIIKPKGLKWSSSSSLDQKNNS